MGQSVPADTSFLDYYAQMNEAVRELAAESCYEEQIKSIASSIRCGHYEKALRELDILNQAFNGFKKDVCILLNQLLESEKSKNQDISLLRCGVIEGARAYAALNGDGEGVTLMEGHLDALDSIVAASIANLDPDRE